MSIIVVYIFASLVAAQPIVLFLSYCHGRGASAYYHLYHSLSQQGVWVSFGHPNPQKSPHRTPKCHFLNCQVFHLNVIPMTFYKDIVPYFNNEIQVFVSIQSILWSPLKNRIPQNFTIANFGNPVSKSWLRPWLWCFCLLLYFV